MAGTSKYTDDDRASVLALLSVNDGNVKRTSRESGVAEQTVRDWKKSWERGGVPATVQATLPSALDDFSTKAESIRDRMLDSLEALVLNDDLSGRDLIVGIGVLTDKLRITRGEATSRTENTVQHVLSPQELGKRVQEALDHALDAGVHRDVEILDAEWDEQADLSELNPSPSTH